MGEEDGRGKERGLKGNPSKGSQKNGSKMLLRLMRDMVEGKIKKRIEEKLTMMENIKLNALSIDEEGEENMYIYRAADVRIANKVGVF